MSAPTSTPFLLDERSRPFVQGLTARPPAMQGDPALGCLLIFGIPFILAGIFMLAYTGSTWLTWLNFSLHAQPATAHKA
jgi:hypothetical protein